MVRFIKLPQKDLHQEYWVIDLSTLKGVVTSSLASAKAKGAALTNKNKNTNYIIAVDIIAVARSIASPKTKKRTVKKKSSGYGSFF